MEKWKPIKGFEGCYEVSDEGRVRSIDRIVTFKDGRTNRRKGIVLTIHINTKRWNYRYANLSRKGKEFPFYVHRLVALHFVSNPGNKPQVNHEDGDKGNNRWKNFKWVTPKENGNHAARMGLVWRKLNRDQVIEIRKEMDKGIRGTRARLARKFGVREGTITFAMETHWRHV